MRVSRMIDGSFRGPAGAERDDVVRRRLGALPVKEVLCIGRLQYASRVSRSAPQLLCLLLQEPAVPWRRTLVEDLAALQAALPESLGTLPCPRVRPQAWEAIWKEHPGARKSLLQRFRDRLVGRAADHGLAPAGAQMAANTAVQLACPQCPPTAQLWTSAKALASHMMARHGHRRWVRFFVADGRCPACGGDFHTRLRAMHHVQHSSKKCSAAVASGCVPPMPLGEVERLDALDSAARSAARRSGRSHLQAFVPARHGRAAAVGDAVSMR